MEAPIWQFLIILGSAFGSLVHRAWDGLNSSFGTALAGAAAGTIAGALTAQFVANRTEGRKAQTLEIRHTNAATNLIVGIVNAHVGLKRQFILPALADIQQTHDKLTSHITARNSKGGIGVEPFHFTSEFRIITPPKRRWNTCATFSLTR
jgi:hypothetical protein